MKKSLSFRKTLLLACFTAFTLTVSAAPWDNLPNPFVWGESSNQDTVHPKKNKVEKNKSEYNSDVEIDKAMEKLDKEMAKLEVEMKKIDYAKIDKQVKEAIAKVDMEKIKRETENAIKKVDWQKIKVEVEKSMKEAQESMKNIDMEKMQRDIEKAHANIKSIDGEKIKKQIEAGMEKEKVGMEKAKADLKYLKDFPDALEKDGLIDTKKGYKIKVQDGELFINGTKQSKETYEKYKQYYKKDNFSINVNGDKISSL